MKKPELSLDKTAESGESAFSVSDILLSGGFGLMLAWHYLVLFSPVFRSTQDSQISSYLFERQLTLYISLALTFGIIGIMNSLTMKRGKRFRPTPVVIYIAGACAVAASVLCTVMPASSNSGLFLAGIALLGITEGLLMFFWLNCFMNKHGSKLLHSFSLDMMLGGFIALLICCLQWPVSPIAAAIAPGLSTIALAWQTSKNLEDATMQDEAGNSPSAEGSASSTELAQADEAGGASLRKEKHWNRYMAISVGVYSLAFGLIQGSFIVANVALLMVENPVVLIGIICAGIIIYLIPEKFDRGLSVDLMHRYSLLLFVIGAVGVAWFNLSEYFLIISQIAILAGFNLFDFGVMAHGMNDRQSGTHSVVHVIEGGRPLVYACLAIGLVLGFLIVQHVDPSNVERTLVTICGVIIVALVATTLIPYYSFYGTSKESEKEYPVELSGAYHGAEAMGDSADKDQPQKQELPEDWVSPWRNACTQIAKIYQLSPRETEIFFLVAKGRNADYVQQKLVISPHTAKTHIANIYRKLEVHSSQELLDLVEEFRNDNHPDAAAEPSKG